MIRLHYLILCAILIFSLSGCETVKGFTTDVANTARNINDIIKAGSKIGDVIK